VEQLKKYGQDGHESIQLRPVLNFFRVAFLLSAQVGLVAQFLDRR